MEKNAIWKWLLLIALTAWSVAVVTPLNDVYKDGKRVKRGKLTYGLDLRGGSRFVLEVDMAALDANARQDAQGRALEVLRGRVDGMGVAEPNIRTEAGNRIVVELPGLKPEDRARAVKNIQSAAFLEFRMVHPKHEELVDDLFEKGLVPPGYEIVSIDEPGYGGQTRQVDYYRRIETAGEPAVEKEGGARLASFQAPAGYEFMLTKEIRNDREVFRPYFVSRRRELTGESLKNAYVDYQNFGQPVVTLRFDSKGAKKFARVTSDYAPGGAKNPNVDGRRYLAIILDSRLYSAPFIKTAIMDGNAIIEGSFSVKEAQDLAVVLRAGALPTPVKLVEERSVDPTLGRDSISSGKRAAIYGGLAVVVFMAGYYLLAGIVANIALVLDIVLLPLGMLLVAGFLSLLTGGGRSGGPITLPTLTLPGIAGIALTIGMAVDANVLIFERIREEQAVGKRLGSAIAAGYEKAFSTILDANVTTLLTAVILFWQGSGPVRGFAVTLSAGIVVSMYTALVVTRMLLNLLAEKTSLPRIRMLSLIGNTSFDFLGKKVFAVLLSVAVIVGTWAYLIHRGPQNLGVDFTGGQSVTFGFEQRHTVQQVRDTLTAAGIKDAQIQYQKEPVVDESGVTKEYLDVRVPFESGERAKQTLLEQYAASGFKVLKEDAVGPQVGKELQKRGLMAMGLALIGIVIYISIRFEFAFAIGAIAALAHDVLITIGVFCLLGRQLSLPIVAALLAIVGYSVNDTIVVFDRIREDLKLMRGRRYHDICNISINQTLSRTLLTSFTTLLTVLMLLVFGGGAINDFALALFIGILVGTYSSIFIATPVMLLWHREKKPAAA